MNEAMVPRVSLHSCKEVQTLADLSTDVLGHEAPLRAELTELAVDRQLPKRLKREGVVVIEGEELPTLMAGVREVVGSARYTPDGPVTEDGKILPLGIYRRIITAFAEDNPQLLQAG